jgi:hypothetical protein
MKTKKEILTNRFGLEFEVEMLFVEFDDKGKPLNEWCVNGHDSAKMLVYKDSTELLSKEEEEKQIQLIMQCGIESILNAKGGDA